MGVIDRIKSALGLGQSDRAVTSDAGGRSRGGDVDVTVEHEPATESEDAVKGTDTDTASGSASTDADTETGGSSTGADAETETGDGDGTEPDSGADDGDAGATESADAAESGGADLEEIKGIGSAYAGRLREAGVEDVSDLADADPEELDAETGIGPNRLANWIDRARGR